MDERQGVASLYAAGAGRGAAWVLPVGGLAAIAALAYYARMASRSELGGPLGHLVSSPAEARGGSVVPALFCGCVLLAVIVEFLVSRRRLALLRLVTWRGRVFVIRAFRADPYRIRNLAAFQMRGPSSRPVETMVDKFDLYTLEMVVGHRAVKIHTRNEFRSVEVERFAGRVRDANGSQSGDDRIWPGMRDPR